MGDIDPEIKNLRVYVDHELNNLRTGLEYIMRNLNMLKQQLGKLEQSKACTKQSFTALDTEIFSLPKAQKGKEDLDESCPTMFLLGNGSKKLSRYMERVIIHPKSKKS